MIERRWSNLLFLMIFFLLLVGCGSIDPNIDDETSYGLKVSVDIGTSLNIEEVEEYITVNMARVALYQGGRFVESKLVEDFSISNQNNEEN